VEEEILNWVETGIQSSVRVRAPFLQFFPRVRPDRPHILWWSRGGRSPVFPECGQIVRNFSDGREGGFPVCRYGLVSIQDDQSWPSSSRSRSVSAEYVCLFQRHGVHYQQEACS
jgi:hypothetical protein